jgi:membrane-bound metal-dependent hydrolase YbcI (DUF457 family)
MKGITHFITGMAAVACLPGSMTAAAAGNPAYLLLGGIFGILPDTIDFKFCRFFYKHHATLIPDPLNPDAMEIATTVSRAIERTHLQKRPTTLKLQTIRLGHNLWRRYSLHIDVAAQRIEVTIGPIVGTSGEPAGPHSTPVAQHCACVPLPCRVQLDYLATTDIDILDGPSFCFAPEPAGVAVQFLPWHRSWSHSLVLAAAAGLVVGTLSRNMLAGSAAATAYAVHAGCDQLGYMGSNLTWPFGKRRTPGQKLSHACDWFPNLAAIWLAMLLLYHGMADASHAESPALLALLFYGMLIPCGVVILLQRLVRRFSAIRLA